MTATTSSQKETDFSDSPFWQLCRKADSATARIAKKMGVDPQSFIDWRWQLQHVINSAEKATTLLRLQDCEEQGFEHLTRIFRVAITPYYLGIADSEDPHCPIRKQALPSSQELHDLHGLSDPLKEAGQSPVPELIHIYPDRVAFCVAGLCATYCRFCFRKRRTGDAVLQFNEDIITRGIDYIASNSAIKDVLLTGGDPFTADDETIDDLLGRIRKIPHVEMIRIGTRTPVTLPYRITPKLCSIIARHHPIWINTHFNCAAEVTEEAQIAASMLVNHGVVLNNQSVLLKGVNNSAAALMALSRKLLAARIRPYYIFHPHTINGTEHFRLTVTEGLHIMQQMRGMITGLGIPTYALDTPSGKIPLSHNYILGHDGRDLILETPRGEIHREPNVL